MIDWTVLLSKSGQMPWKQSPISGPNQPIWLRLRFMFACAHVAYSTRSFRLDCAFARRESGRSANVRIIGSDDRNDWYFTHTSKTRLRISLMSGPMSDCGRAMSLKMLATPVAVESTSSQ
jgi:hypothetical protein